MEEVIGFTPSITEREGGEKKEKKIKDTILALDKHLLCFVAHRDEAAWGCVRDGTSGIVRDVRDAIWPTG